MTEDDITEAIARVAVLLTERNGGERVGFMLLVLEDPRMAGGTGLHIGGNINERYHPLVLGRACAMSMFPHVEYNVKFDAATVVAAADAAPAQADAVIEKARQS